MSIQNKMLESADKISKELSAYLPKTPQIAFVLGSGWESVIKSFQNTQIIPYNAFQDMPRCTVSGHAGNFIYGELFGKAVLALQGRFHLYEGYTPTQVILPIQVIYNLGIQKLVLTNASGGINLNYQVGDIMLLDGHINFTGQNPLIGVQATEKFPIFIDTQKLYSNPLQKKIKDAAKNMHFTLKKGVYLQTLGPNYETPAEICMFRKWGADAVGMSTVLESLYAHYLKMEVSALSLISNMAAGIDNGILTHKDVLRQSKLNEEKLQKLIKEIIKSIA